MSFKPKFWIVYPRSLYNQIEYGGAPAYFPDMLRKRLGVQTIASELKLIWNDEHRIKVMKSLNVTSVQLNDYMEADSNMLSFSAEGTRRRTVKVLEKMGAKTKDLILVDNYRDVVLYQAYYQNEGAFPSLDNTQTLELSGKSTHG